MSRILLASLLLVLTGPVHAAETPEPKPGDRLAICGDSITEQKMYSRIMETYLTVCVPDLGIPVRQFGWSGERVPGGNLVKSG